MSMYSYKIQGGYPLSGTITASGNKNAALPCIVASILTDEKVIIHNIPEIEDVKVICSILTSIGIKATQLTKNSWEFQVENLISEVPAESAKALRASILLAGPLLARTKEVILPPPGGDVIGRRRLDTHFLAFCELGAKVTIEGSYIVKANQLVGADIFLDEASVTATENAIMCAVLAKGKSIIRNAASEPHVQDLCNMLNQMGAKITGIGSNILYIEGQEKLYGTEFTIGADFMEVGSFIGLAAVTHSDIVIQNAGIEHLRMTKLAYNKLGIHWNIEGSAIHVPAQQELSIIPDMGGMIPKIDDAPWPGFPADLTSIVTVIATQVNGTVLVHEKLFESRMFFVDKLISMGARIVLCDPHRAVINGPARLHGSELSSPDVRAGMAMVIAALCANGESLIHNVYQIERGYENLVGKLKNLGAKIERLKNS